MFRPGCDFLELLISEAMWKLKQVHTHKLDRALRAHTFSVIKVKRILI